MKIIDAHMHLPVDHPSPEDKKNALLAHMTKNGVGKGVVIADSELESVIGTVEECAGLFSGCDDIRVVGGISPFIDYENRLELMKTLLSDGKLAGLKLYCGHEPFYLDDDVLAPVFAMAEQFDVPVLFHTGWDEPQYTVPEVIARTADRYPDVRLVCCHCCYPEIEVCLETLRVKDNVLFDLSSIADDPDRRSRIAELLERYIPSMPERFLFGSDYGSCAQEPHIELCAGLNISDEHKSMLLCGNACRIYRF